MSESDAGYSGSFSVFIASGGDFGAMGEVRRHTQPFTISRTDIERARKSHYTYETVVEINQLAQRASIGVIDDTTGEFGLASLVMPKRK